MKKIIRIGIKEKKSVFCKITYENGRLSISGVEAPMANGNCKGSCGQINPITIEKFAKGWDKAKLKRFNFLWAAYHLNDLKAGCEHQNYMGWDKDGYDKHPSEPCPVCGYKFGTAWHVIPIPQEVIDFLFSLPDSDRVPAWI